MREFCHAPEDKGHKREEIFIFTLIKISASYHNDVCRLYYLIVTHLFLLVPLYHDRCLLYVFGFCITDLKFIGILISYHKSCLYEDYIKFS